MAEDVSVMMHDPKTAEIGKFVFVMSLAMLASQSGTYMNVCTPLFEQKYNWDTEG